MSDISQVTVDRSGRILIPKEIRTRLGLSPGAKLVMVTQNDQEILLRPVQEQPELVDKGGVLVVRGLAAGRLDGIEKQAREARLGQLLQKSLLPWG